MYFCIAVLFLLFIRGVPGLPAPPPQAQLPARPPPQLDPQQPSPIRAHIDRSYYLLPARPSRIRPSTHVEPPKQRWTLGTVLSVDPKHLDEIHPNTIFSNSNKPVHTIVVPVLQGDTFIYFLAPGVTSDSAAREYKDFVPARDYFPGSGLRGFMYIGHWYSVSESSIDRSWRTGRLRNFNPAEIRKLNNLIRQRVLDRWDTRKDVDLGVCSQVEQALAQDAQMHQEE